MTAWPAFEVRREQLAGTVTLHVAGELDIAQTARLDDAIVQAAAGAAELVLDLRQVSFCDSSGLAVLLRARRAPARLVPSDAVLHVARLACLDEVLFGAAGPKPSDSSA